jgi:hypothetical protein
VIASPADFPTLFSCEIPPGATISDQAAAAIARLLWDRAERELAAEAQKRTQNHEPQDP